MRPTTATTVIEFLRAGGAARDHKNADEVDDIDNLRASLEHGAPHHVYFNCGDDYEGVRLFFPGKPADEIRDRLKRGGFRWTPSLGCWQAYINASTRALGRAVAGVTEVS